MTTVVRSPRGRWAVLSPAYPWPIKDRLKTYPSLLNYLADDCFTKPSHLLSERIPVSNDRVVNGLKLLLYHNPQFKNYLHKSPKDVRYINRYHPELEVYYTSNLISARDAISKFRVKGDEVIERQKEFEMLGATINGDEAVFDYDAKKDVEKIIYSVDTKGWNDDMMYIGDMIESYIYINNQNPPFIEEKEIFNPTIFYVAKKKHGENVARLLTKINMSEFKEIKMETLEELLVKIRDLSGSKYMYYVFPKKLHYSLKEDMTLSDVRRMLKYHVENGTSNVPEIMARLKLFQELTCETKKDEMRKIIMDEFEKPRDEENITMTNTYDQETFYIDTPEELEELNVDDHHGPYIEEIMDTPPIIDEGSLESARSDRSDTPPPPDYPPPPLDDGYIPKITESVKSIFQSVMSPPQPATQPPLAPQKVPQKVTQPVPRLQPVTPPPQSVTPQPVTPPPPRINFDEKFKLLDNSASIGKVIEPDENISPFNTRMMVFEDTKYKGIISAIYNLAIRDLLNTDKTYSSTPAALRKKLLQEVEEEQVVEWWKEKGWLYLEKMVSSEQYVEKLYSHRHKDSKPLVFLASKRAMANTLLEPYIGVVKLGNGDDKTNSVSWKGGRLRGYNVMGSLL